MINSKTEKSGNILNTAVLKLSHSPETLSDKDNTMCIKTMQTIPFILGSRLSPVQYKMACAVLKIN